MSGAHLHSVGLHVSDLGATASFYRLLGLRVPDDQAPVVAVAVPSPESAKVTPTWVTTAVLQALDPVRVTDPARRVQIEIGYDNASDVDAAWTSATTAGHRGVAEPFDAPWG